MAGKYIRIGDYFTHLLQEVIKADTEFKLQQAWSRKSIHDGPVDASYYRGLQEQYMKDMTAEQLNIDSVELCLYLKKEHPRLLRRLWLRITGKKPEDLYKPGTQKDCDIPVKFIIKRVDAFAALHGTTDPEVYADKYISM